MREASLALSLTAFAFMLTVIWGEPLLRILRHFKVGKIIRVEGPSHHMTKMGTPTMGGVLIILPVVFVTVLLNAVSLIGLDFLGRSILLPMLALLAYGALGAIDDWQGLHGTRAGKGMTARVKFVGQWGLALGIAWVLKDLLQVPHLIIPGIQGEIDLGIAYIFIAAFIIVAESNAVNFTDGLDGLAGLISATAFAAFGIIALSQGQIFLARFCFTIVGALFGFLWFNVHPAQLIMGDTGSLPLGAVLAIVALMTGQWPLLLVVAIIPLSEVISVVLQVGYFKLTKGKRLFKMAPLHHHFELLGWSETQVVQRFWLISLMAAMIGIGFAMVRG
jgi:phospho-N-acetylmuramoyl-pentapeptide-transferase